jgi:hypothetical protein
LSDELINMTLSDELINMIFSQMSSYT